MDSETFLLTTRSKKQQQMVFVAIVLTNMKVDEENFLRRSFGIKIDLKPSGKDKG
jgi:hypothetical protein